MSSTIIVFHMQGRRSLDITAFLMEGHLHALE
jgi:hypothetical protein